MPGRPIIPSKMKSKGPENHSISLHPTIPEETEASTKIKNVIRQRTLIGSDFGISTDTNTFNDSVSQPYAEGRDQLGS